jgi:hypothetical protein
MRSIQARVSVSVSAPLLAMVLSTSSPVAHADQTIRCESDDYHYKSCSISDHGYVRLKRQISKTDCVKGRNWDYNRRSIWVDDGCAAEFVVEDRWGSSGHRGGGNGDSGKTAAAVAAIAILGAAAIAANRDQDDDEPGRGHAGHSSYIPGWMIGSFHGYNHQHRTPIDMRIDRDGRMDADAKGHRLSGYVNGGRLYVGDVSFEIQRSGDGFDTVQVGNYGNRVHYTRR